MDADELQERFLDFVRMISTREALRDGESSALRAQVHDLTELLAAFDLCELQDPHLIAVRDRAFQRDISSDIELLHVQTLERQLEQMMTRNGLVNDSNGDIVANGENYGENEEDPDGSDVGEKTESEEECIKQRMELLERDIVILRLRQELLEEMTPRFDCLTVNDESIQASQDLDVENEQTQEELQEHQIEHTTTIQEQQKRILALEKALAMTSAKNEVLKRQSLRFQQVESILQDFSGKHSSLS